MTEIPGTLRSIAWSELFPWLILFRTFRIAISPTLLAVATAAVLATSLGWSIAGRIFLTPEQRLSQPPGSQLEATLPAQAAAYLPPSVRTPLVEAYAALAEPLARFFQLKLTLREAAFYLFGFLWTLAVWSLPGGMITRRAVVQLATDAAPGAMPTATFAAARFHWYFLAPLGPLLVIVLLAAPIAAVGLLFRASPGLGAALAGLVWVLVAIAGVGAMWIFGGLLFGWPLMWPAISAERDGDAFEAFSRSYSYVYGKPLHYFFYVVVAAAFGALCWAVVWTAAAIVREFGFWALSWGCGGEVADQLRLHALDIANGEFIWRDNARLWNFGVVLIGAVIALLHAAVAAFRFTFFFTAASAIYLLLRFDVDEKELDEVYQQPAEVPQAAPTKAPSPAAADAPPPSNDT
jgi:hypothetical protein